jgi:hypothetical protein
VIAKVTQSWSVIGWVTKIYYLKLFRALEDTLSRWSRLHLQSLPPTNSYWGRVVGYSPFSLYVINKEVLCPSSGDINRQMTIKRDEIKATPNLIQANLRANKLVFYKFRVFCVFATSIVVIFEPAQGQISALQKVCLAKLWSFSIINAYCYTSY